MEPSNGNFQKVRSQREVGIQTVIGFEDDARRLVEQLVGGKKQLQFISVVGMTGLGKTTLVKKVFDEPSVVYHFYVLAWTTVTQEPKKRDLILGILKSGFNAGNEDSDDMELSLSLKRRLSGQRYLVVLDDIWDSEDWNDLMLCFPDDNVGSRIIFTTRLADVPLQVQSRCYQHPLRFLNEKESWDLLQYKVFLDESCPFSLVEIGKQVAKKCQGLPLSIVVIAGILASDTTMDWWSQVAQDMSSIAGTAPEQYMDTLALSYNHLPDHLKPCFLYFAAFPEDYEIPAWKLILLWVAEGFIKIQTAENNLENEGNTLEDVAACYLRDLITRSLVMVSKRRSNGGIKSCIVHDALRDLCNKKADEENFLHQMPTFYRNKTRYHDIVSQLKTSTTSLVKRLYSREVDEVNFIAQLIRYFGLPTPIKEAPCIYQLSIIIPRAIYWIKFMCTNVLDLNVQTILAYNRSGNPFLKVKYTEYSILNVLGVFKYLRVMDLYSIRLSRFPKGITNLPELRYVSLCIKAHSSDSSNTISFPISIDRLKLLETLIVHDENQKVLGALLGVWNLCRLRHLILKGNIRVKSSHRLQPLLGLQTLCLSFKTKSENCKKIFGITPNLRKLVINGYLYDFNARLTLPNLDKLLHLENLSLQNKFTQCYCKKLHREISSPNMFPVTLKELTLVCTYLKWDEMQKIGRLPNLEVLKLQYEAFVGERWETVDGGFCQLKHLSFKFMKFVHWSAYSDQFPNLQHLRLDECTQLEEIPIGIGDICTLDMIEVRNCHPAVVQSARRIKKDQENKGYDLLKVSIFQE